jgi:hypothetical protein
MFKNKGSERARHETHIKVKISRQQQINREQQLQADKMIQRG